MLFPAVAAGIVPEKDASQFVEARDNTFVSQLSDGTVLLLEGADVHAIESVRTVDRLDKSAAGKEASSALSRSFLQS